MNQPHAAVALAGGDERICAITVTTPTDFARFFVRSSSVANTPQALVLVLGSTDAPAAANLHSLDLEFDAAELKHSTRLDLVLTVADVAVNVAHDDEHALAWCVI